MMLPYTPRTNALGFFAINPRFAKKKGKERSSEKDQVTYDDDPTDM